MYEDSMVYSLVTLVKAGLDWKYVGKTHEYLNHVGKDVKALSFDDIHIKHHHDGGSRSDKFTRDLNLLLEDHQEDPENYRTVFYLAQTCGCLGNTQDSYKFYSLRIKEDDDGFIKNEDGSINFYDSLIEKKINYPNSKVFAMVTERIVNKTFNRTYHSLIIYKV